MQTSEVLNKAADEIQVRGWVQLEGWRETDSSPLCLEGGIMAALNLRDDDYEKGQRGGLYFCPAYWAVANYLGRNPSPPSGPISDALWQWNDDKTRTADEVIEVLRASALIEEARERQPGPIEAVS